MYQSKLTFNTTDTIFAHKESGKNILNGHQPPKLLARIAGLDQTAVSECVETYGNLIWNLATGLTRSTVDAENAAQNIFLDIWQNAKDFDCEKNDEQSFIKLIALRRLLKNNEQGRIL